MFKLGDKVNTIYGNGYIVTKDNQKHAFPITLFNGLSGHAICIDSAGKNATSVYPVAWHDETGSPPVIGESPAFVLTKPTWCWVWGDQSETHYIRLISHYTEGMYVVLTSDGGSHGQRFTYAEPCNEEHIPDCWPKEWI